MGFLDRPYTITREHADLYVERVGPQEAPVVFYLHGGPGYNSHSFRNLMGDDLENYHMIYADQRGAGRSYSDVPFGLDTLADDVRVILEALGIERANLLAHGFGAQIAVRACLSLEQRITRLVLVNPWFSMPMLARSLQRQAAITSGHAEEALPTEALLDDAEPLDPDSLVEQAFAWVPAKILLDAMEFPKPASRLRLEHSDGEALFGPQETAHLEAPWTLEVLRQLGDIHHPVTLLAGRQDLTSFPEQIEAGLRRMPHALVSLLEGGHYPWLDDANTFLAVLRQALTTSGS